MSMVIKLTIPSQLFLKKFKLAYQTQIMNTHLIMSKSTQQEPFLASLMEQCIYKTSILMMKVVKTQMVNIVVYLFIQVLVVFHLDSKSQKPIFKLKVLLSIPNLVSKLPIPISLFLQVTIQKKPLMFLSQRKITPNHLKKNTRALKTKVTN